MKRLFVSAFMIALLFIGKEAQANSPYLEFSPQSGLRVGMNLAMQDTVVMDSNLVALHNHPDYILPKKALLFSVLIPGAGELYCKSYIKSALFFGIEVGAWTMYAVFHKKGTDKEKEFEAYANEYWDADKWQAWFNNLTEDQQKVFSHSLPETKTQQYYEMIGKYNQFLVGWDNVPDNLSTSEIHEHYSQLREDYMDMRYDSNKMYKRSNTGAYLAMFNHVLSAIDAAWTAKRHNGRLIKTSLQFENKFFNNEDHPMFSLKINW